MMHADGPLKAAPESVSQQPDAVWMAAAFEQMLENAVVLAREADKQLGLVEEDSKVGQCREKLHKVVVETARTSGRNSGLAPGVQCSLPSAHSSAQICMHYNCAGKGGGQAALVARWDSAGSARSGGRNSGLAPGTWCCCRQSSAAHRHVCVTCPLPCCGG